MARRGLPPSVFVSAAKSASIVGDGAPNKPAVLATEHVITTLLDVARKLDAQERKFRQALREAATAGDVALVQKILDVWEKGADFDR